MKRAVILAVVALCLLPEVAVAQDATPTPNGDRGRPIPLGTAATITETWSITVLAVYNDPRDIDPKATWFLDWLDTNPVPKGQRFLTVRLAIENIGVKAGQPITELRFAFVTPTDFTYDGMASCGNVPGALAPFDQIDAGDTGETTVCRLVNDKDVDTVLLVVEEAPTVGGISTPVWFALRSESATPEA